MQAVCAVFFVNPEDLIRTLMYYPLSTGRNFDEIYRTLIALKATDAFGIATPAD